MQGIRARSCLLKFFWADSMPFLPAKDPRGPNPPATAERRRAMQRGLLALAVAWLAWFYWFSRAAILAIATVAAGLILLLLVRTTLRMLQAGGGVYRQLCLRLLLSLVRRVV